MPRQESEGEVTQGETVGFDRSDRFILSPVERVLPGEPANKGPVLFIIGKGRKLKLLKPTRDQGKAS